MIGSNFGNIQQNTGSQIDQGISKQGMLSQQNPMESMQQMMQKMQEMMGGSMHGMEGMPPGMEGMNPMFGGMPEEMTKMMMEFINKFLEMAGQQGINPGFGNPGFGNPGMQGTPGGQGTGFAPPAQSHPRSNNTGGGFAPPVQTSPPQGGGSSPVQTPQVPQSSNAGHSKPSSTSHSPSPKQERTEEPKTPTASSEKKEQPKTPELSTPSASNDKPEVSSQPADKTSVPGDNKTPKANSADSPFAKLPPRPENAMTGSEFAKKTQNMSRNEREKLILEEIRKGNIPDSLRNMQDVTVETKGKDGKMHSATYKVAPDYLAIGSDKDNMRIPMDPQTAQKIADEMGCVLPTKKMVDDIYKNADTKVKPDPLSAKKDFEFSKMMSSDYYKRHNDLIEKQLGGKEDNGLVAGQKKDIIITNMLDQNPGRVGIYGWHQPDGKAIQGRSTIHENTYADYSHGARMISGTMVVDGVEMPVSEVLKDPNLAGLISDEGTIKNSRYKYKN
jgi:hypothetical protein